MYPLLQGMRILDLTRLLPGGYATQLLGDLGAEVLKVEDTSQGDYMRQLGVHFPDSEESALYWGLNRNKKSIRLNLKSEAGKEIFFQLLQTYDVVMEGFRPGVMEKLGLGYEQLKQANPAVIMCSISGYGQDGPYKQRAGHDINFTAIAGALGQTGAAEGTPIIPAVQIADIGGGGLMAAVGVLAASIARQNTGQGQYVDVAMLDGVVSWMTMLFMQLAVNDPTAKRGKGWLNGGLPCYSVYETKDARYVSIGALEDKFWQEFCRVVGREDLICQQFSPEAWVKSEVEVIFKAKTREEWQGIAAEHDLCLEPVLDLAEVKQHPQVLARELFSP
ncbi:MAG: CoA transferase, partial [Peptococcaceae bacterium]|nr:CoA transferase [Peptococcaceae bacterium]